MVDLALPRALHALGQGAVSEAEARRATSVEAEHLLLAILASPRGQVTAKLERHGLTYGGMIDALELERNRSLGTAGIVPIPPSALIATHRTTKPGWGASIRNVLRGADKPAAKDGSDGAIERELAIAILSIGLGTVPRALALAGLDRQALVEVLRQPGP